MVPRRPARRAAGGPAGSGRRAAVGATASSAGSRWSCSVRCRWVRWRSPRPSCGPGGRCSWSAPSCTTWRADASSPPPGRGCSRRRRTARARRSRCRTARRTASRTRGPTGWHGGYLDAVEWRWVSGSVTEPGPGVVWMRPPALVAGEAISPLQRLLACVDSASGVSAALDVRRWAFLNTELTVHVLRPPVGEWVCLEAATTLGSGSVGVATRRGVRRPRAGGPLRPGPARHPPLSRRVGRETAPTQAWMRGQGRASSSS